MVSHMKWDKLIRRKNPIIIGSFLVAIFITGVCAYTSPSGQSPSKRTGVDIDLLSVIPGNNVSSQSVEIYNIPGHVPTSSLNFTSAFAFAPAKDLFKVNSTSLTLIYLEAVSPPPSGMRLNVFANGLSVGFVLLQQVSGRATASGPLNVQAVHPGANSLMINPAPGVDVTLYQVRLTVEYTFST